MCPEAVSTRGSTVVVVDGVGLMGATGGGLEAIAGSSGSNGSTGSGSSASCSGGLSVIISDVPDPREAKTDRIVESRGCRPSPHLQWVTIRKLLL